MDKNRICSILSIKYPIIQGGMLWLADARLASSVSNAGGLGIISPLAGMDRHGDRIANLKQQVEQVRKLTANSFGVNVPLDLVQSPEMIDLLFSEKVPIVVTAAGDPSIYTELLKSADIKVLHVVSSVKQAKIASACNVDSIIVEGVEAGGHDGVDEIPLFALLPQVVDAVSQPIIAAGGIVDGRGWAAAVALGAEGVQLGTRFVVTEECPAHPKYKEAILKAVDTDTVITCRPLVPTRSLKTELTRHLVAMERQGASAEAIREFLGYSRARRAQLEGNLEDGEAYCGAAAGLIRDILPARAIVNRLISEYEEVRAHFASF
jgi:enoyl-[acyl-carrier protein] reductase II